MGNGSKSRKIKNKVKGKTVVAALVTSSTIIGGVFAALSFFKNDNNVIHIELTVSDTGTNIEEEVSEEYLESEITLDFDDPLYGTYAEMIEEMKVEIAQNPVVADMCAQGFKDLELSDGTTIGDLNPWIDEYLEKTDFAMDLPYDVHPRGVFYWVTLREGEGDKLFVTDEYRLYAARLILLLNRMECIGIVEKESVANWHLVVDEDLPDSQTRATKNDEQVNYPALAFKNKSSVSDKEFEFRFCLYDKRFIIYQY